jgi:transmembrane sensor
MTFQEFDQLLKRYLKGQCTPEEAERIEKWYASYDKDTPDILEGPLKTSVEERLWHTLDKTNTASGKRRFLSRPYISGIAAAMLLLILSVWFLNEEIKVSPSPIESKVKTETIVANTTTTVLLHALADGSRVSLQPGSEIRYLSGQFSDIREVKLIGEAFFEVKKDKEHPFLVYTGGLVTKVLGTSFNVSARKDVKEIIVSVKTGKVSVFTQRKHKEQKEVKEEVILTPNQKAIYDTFSDKVVKGLVKGPEKVKTEPAAKIRFTNVSVLEIFQILEDSYGIEIRLDHGNLSACTVTTTLANESLFEKLDIICQAIGADYKVVNASVIIEGKGCN